MGKEHRLAERRQAILTVLEEVGQMSVTDLSLRFDVSEVTIRQDLRAMGQQGLLLRTRGGAYSSNTLPELSFELRQQQSAAQKARIGRVAAGLVHYGDTIFLDASTTAQTIIFYIKQFTELTVITNSLRVAFNLLDAPHIHVILPGGSLRRTSISLVDQPRCDLIEDLNIQIGFFGARGLTIAEGLTDVSLGEVQMKRTMVERCQHVVGLIDASKWGKVATSTFAYLPQIDTIISDTAAPTNLVEQVQQQVEVILV